MLFQLILGIYAENGELTYFLMFFLEFEMDIGLHNKYFANNNTLISKNSTKFELYNPFRNKYSQTFKVILVDYKLSLKWFLICPIFIVTIKVMHVTILFITLVVNGATFHLNFKIVPHHLIRVVAVKKTRPEDRISFFGTYEIHRVCRGFQIISR